MDTAERCEFLRAFLDGVYIDVKRKRIVEGAARPAFRSLFAACEGAVIRVSAPEGADLNSVSGDPEGIRTLDLHRDRVAC
jgi:hypothetical protein